MAYIDEIPVYYEGFLVGRITHDAKQSIEFTYDPQWLATKGSFPLSVTLPLEMRPYEESALLTWLANLLPEGPNLTGVSRGLGISTSDALEILKVIGGDIAGAFSIGLPSIRDDWRYTPLLTQYDVDCEEAALRMHFADLGKRPFLVGEEGVRISLAGGQKKTALAVLNEDGCPELGLPEPGDRLAIPKNGAPSTVILKPDNPALPGVLENEAYCLCLAKLVGLEAVDCTITETTEGKALVVARYDRQMGHTGSIKRLHQEDFAQANRILPGRKYEHGSVAGLSLNSILQTGTHLPPGEVLNLLDQVIFNILIANTDAHAKNYSMILSAERRVAPLYDACSSLLWEHMNQYHAQKIAGHALKPGEVTRKHWECIARDTGLNARSLRLRVQELARAIMNSKPAATETVGNLPGALPEMVGKVADLVETIAQKIASEA